MPSSITVPWMFTDEAGDTRFDAFALPMASKAHAPLAGPLLAAEHQSAVSYPFFLLPPKWVGDAHPELFKSLVLCLTGEFRFVMSPGDAIIMRPGDKLLETDTTGKGHVPDVLSDIPVECLIVRLE
ncbi:MAG: hypothetical protein ACKVP7_01205 [Hyphomicrobiaceae bacterium]